MFTGIIEETGIVKKISTDKIFIMCSKVLEDVTVGDSIAVNGVCLTVVEYAHDYFVADVSAETRRVTNLGSLCAGDTVNLERALPSDGRFGGHIVSGHIDGVARVAGLKQSGDFAELEIQLGENEYKYVVKKGSITVNGVSLTVAALQNRKIKLFIIPHTFENTNLQSLRVGDIVNVETDILSKYVEKFLSTGDNESRIDLDFLQRNGF